MFHIVLLLASAAHAQDPLPLVTDIELEIKACRAQCRDPKNREPNQSFDECVRDCLKPAGATSQKAKVESESAAPKSARCSRQALTPVLQNTGGISYGF
jgi:hypothetical protein